MTGFFSASSGLGHDPGSLRPRMVRNWPGRNANPKAPATYFNLEKETIKKFKPQRLACARIPLIFLARDADLEYKISAQEISDLANHLNSAW